MTGLPRADRWVEVRPGTLEALVEVARTRGHVVLDTGFSLEDDPAGDFGARPGRNHLTQAALSVADEVVVVGAADPVGLARLARAVAELQEGLLEGLEGVPVRVVVNRMRPTLGWSREELTGMVAGFTTPAALHFLPDDQACVDKALLTGRALGEAAPDAPLVRALDELAAALVPELAPRPRRSLLRRRTAARARRP